MSPRSTNNITSGSRACQLPAPAQARSASVSPRSTNSLTDSLFQPEGGWRLHAPGVSLKKL
jgi:hypothetical protein